MRFSESKLKEFIKNLLATVALLALIAAIAGIFIVIWCGFIGIRIMLTGFVAFMLCGVAVAKFESEGKNAEK